MLLFREYSKCDLYNTQKKQQREYLQTNSTCKEMPGARRPQSSGSGRLGGSRGGGLSVDQLKMSQRGQNSRGGLASTRPSAGMGPPSAEKESRYHVEVCQSIAVFQHDSNAGFLQEAVVLRHQSEVRRSAATELVSRTHRALPDHCHKTVPNHRCSLSLLLIRRNY